MRSAAGRRRLALLVLTPVLAVVAGGSAVGSVALPGDRAARLAVPAGPTALRDAPTAYLVELEGAPSSRVAEQAQRRGASRAQAGADARAQRARNDDAQDTVAATARRRGLVDAELFRVGTLINGIAVRTTAKDAEALADLDGVKSVVPIPEHERTNGYTDPFIGATEAWKAAGGGYTGTGIKAAVIDTGIDYVHANFGGRGTAGDLTVARDPANNPPRASTDAGPSSFTVTNGATQLFPSVKVAGGFDFAGDAYNANSAAPSAAAQPDPNPGDCPTAEGGGHGSHVAGTLGGYGENADGSTFTGSYDGKDTKAMKIGPGVAPDVTLYAVRVFGCTGSTNLTVRALEWVSDPNGDGNTADHLDVANLSLGSSFGNDDDPTATAADAAAVAGVAVVFSAGNSGDTTYISGSPGSARRAITVANMNAGETRDGFLMTVAAPNAGLSGLKAATESVNFNWPASSAVTAPLVYPGTNQTGCSAFAAGSLTGKIVLLDWKTTAGGTSPCGSTLRTDNAQAAGAVGVILADPELSYTVSISGNAFIPAMLTNKPGQDALKAALATGSVVTIRFSHADYAASGHDDYPQNMIAASSSRGATGSGGLKPDIAAPGTGILSASSGTGCGGKVLTGTSMASPVVAGTMALLRERHPTWTVEQLKALAMNTASNDVWSGAGKTGTKYAPQRVGTGIVQVPAALTDDVIAYDASAGGAVGVGFGALEVPVGAPFERDRTITVLNRASTARSYTASYVAGTAVPGAVYELPDGAAVEVPAGGTATFRVRLKVADPAALRNVRDPTMAATQASYARSWLAEAAGLVRLTSVGDPSLSVPVHAALKPVDDLHVARRNFGMTAASGSAQLDMLGTALSTGAGLTDWRSYVTFLEWQFSSPQLTFPAGTQKRVRNSDLREIGVGASGGFVTFGASTWGRRASPYTRDGGIEVDIDTDRDGTDDFALYSDRFFDDATNQYIDFFISKLLNLHTSAQTAAPLPLTPPWSAAAPGSAFDTDVLTMDVTLASLGLTASSKFDYRVLSVAGGDVVDTTPKLTFDLSKAGVDFTDMGAPFLDGAGAFPFTWNTTNLAANGSLGALLIHHQGAAGKRAETVRIAAQAPPTAVPGGPYVVPEGQAVNPDASASTDPDDDPFTFAWDTDGDSTFESALAKPPAFVVDDGPLSRTMHLQLKDADNPAVVTDVPLTVTNVAPAVSASAIGSPPTGLHLEATDPSTADADAGYTFQVDVGADGSADATTSGTVKDLAVAFPTGTSTVRVTATDKDGGVSSPVELTVTVPAPPAGPGPGPGTTPTTPSTPTTPTTPVTPVTLKPPAARCVVPKLKGKTLKQAAAALKKARCALGKVTKPRRARGTLVVSTQSVRAGRKVARGTKVAVKLVVKPRPKPKPKPRPRSEAR